MVSKPCCQCREPVEFPDEPGDGECASCGQRQYVTATGAVGRYPSGHLKAGPGL